MRRLIAFALLCVVSVAGCSTPWSRTHCGYGFYFDHPSSVESNTSILVNRKAGDVEAQAIGGAAGPVQQGQFFQGPKNGQPMMPFVMPNNRIACDSACPPYNPAIGDSCEGFWVWQKNNRTLPPPLAK